MKSKSANVLGVLLTVSSAVFAAVQLNGRAQSRALTIDQLIDIKHPSMPMWSPDSRNVVYLWDRAGVSHVYAANAESGAPRLLEQAGPSLNGAFWSPDSRALMTIRDGDLWRVPIDGTSASAIWTTPEIESNIISSPDAMRVAFFRGSSIVVRALAGGRETIVVPDAGRNPGALGWSPDGQYLVYAAGGQSIRHEQTPAYRA